MLLSQYGVQHVEAFGERRSVREWAESIGVDARVLKQRLQVLPAEIALLFPHMICVKRFSIPEGEPKSWTWEMLPWTDDPWAQRFVEEHPGGATLSEVGGALGITRERVRQIEEVAMRKLRRGQRGQRLRERLWEQAEDVILWRSRRSAEP